MTGSVELRFVEALMGFTGLLSGFVRITDCSTAQRISCLIHSFLHLLHLLHFLITTRPPAGHIPAIWGLEEVLTTKAAAEYH